MNRRLFEIGRPDGRSNTEVLLDIVRAREPGYVFTYDELIAARFDPERLRQHVGADTLAFLSVEGMMTAIGKKSGYCAACFTGKYPVDVSGVTPKETFEFALA